ncbi:hypothetical protein PSPO01_07614 [Paraphaeosphaeria sporulosa]
MHPRQGARVRATRILAPGRFPAMTVIRARWASQATAAREMQSRGGFLVPGCDGCRQLSCAGPFALLVTPCRIRRLVPNLSGSRAGSTTSFRFRPTARYPRAARSPLTQRHDSARSQHRATTKKPSLCALVLPTTRCLCLEPAAPRLPRAASYLSKPTALAAVL